METDLPGYLIFEPIFQVTFIEVAGYLTLLLLLIIGSALVSGSEVAFFSLDANDMALLEEEKSKSSLRILKLSGQHKKLLATILIANNFLNIAIVLVADQLIRMVLPENLSLGWASWVIENIGIFKNAEGLARSINFLITVVAVTVVLVLFGEIAPKIYAKVNNIKLAGLMSKPLLFLVKLFKPFSHLLISGTGLIEAKLSKKQQSSNLTSKEEIDTAIDLTDLKSKTAMQEAVMLKSIVKFGDLMVKQIMCSRVDVVSIDITSSFDEVLKIVRESGFSRLPVYQDDFDKIKGILYVKDLLGFLNEKAGFNWQDLIHEKVLFIPETKKIDDLLKEFQLKHLHIAIVVDEYGGSAGIVTLEDILEEVIGEIMDEFDHDIQVEYEKIDDHTFIFEGKTLLNDVCKITGIDTTAFDEVRGDSDSIAGLILELAGKFPKKNTVFNVDQYKFKIKAVNTKRIEKIQISLPA